MTMRPTAILALLLCATACAEEETPRILQGTRGACGSVVEGATPSQVECPSACPIAVEAYRVLNNASCERASTQYVACVNPGGAGNRGAALLDTEDGTIFIDDPTYDCQRDDGCALVDPTTTERWSTCGVTEDEACGCVCQGGECPFDRFSSALDGCGFPSPCAALTGDTERTDELLQCYLDELAAGGPLQIEVDVPMTNDLTGESSTGRRIIVVNQREAIRIDEHVFDGPSASCDLQSASFYFDCVPDEPMSINVENEQGMVERLPCTDPRAWLINCEKAAPVCPS